MRVTSHPESILNDSQFKACASEISCMSDFTDGCAEKHFFPELLVVLEGYRMNFILVFYSTLLKILKRNRHFAFGTSLFMFPFV